MPNEAPPKHARPSPRFFQLPAGSFLWTVASATSPPDSVFRPPPVPLELGGRPPSGRFDPTPDCPYPYSYAAFDDLTALCEVLLRDVGYNAPLRYLPRETVAGRRLILLETLRPLWLIRLLDAADLAAACQDSWLVHAERTDYGITRLWAHWLRDSTDPDGSGAPAGIVWRSKRQPSGRAVLFFGDRCGDAVIRSPFGERRLDDEAGLQWLGRRLSLLRTRLAPAARFEAADV
jgi:RES domain